MKLSGRSILAIILVVTAAIVFAGGMFVKHMSETANNGRDDQSQQSSGEGNSVAPGDGSMNGDQGNMSSPSPEKSIDFSTFSQEDVGAPSKDKVEEFGLSGDEPDWQYALKGFATAYGDPSGGKSKWLERLHPYATPKMNDTLKNLPDTYVKKRVLVSMTEADSNNLPKEIEEDQSSVAAVMHFKDDPQTYVVGMVYRGDWQVDTIGTYDSKSPKETSKMLGDK